MKQAVNLLFEALPQRPSSSPLKRLTLPAEKRIRRGERERQKRDWHLPFFESVFFSNEMSQKKKLRSGEKRVNADDTWELRAQAMHGLPVR